MSELLTPAWGGDKIKGEISTLIPHGGKRGATHLGFEPIGVVAARIVDRLIADPQQDAA